MVSAVGVVVLVVALVAATAFGLLRRHRSGRVRATGDETRLTAETLGGQPLGERATLVQFSSAFCRPW